VKAKVHFHDEIFALIIDDEWTFEQLFGVLTDKVSQFDSMLSRNSVFKLRYKDEDGDYISIRSDDDLRLAIKLCMTGRYALNLYLTAIQ
jgi:cell division control protein 24